MVRGEDGKPASPQDFRSGTPGEPQMIGGTPGGPDPRYSYGGTPNPDFAYQNPSSNMTPGGPEAGGTPQHSNMSNDHIGNDGYYDHRFTERQ